MATLQDVVRLDPDAAEALGRRLLQHHRVLQEDATSVAQCLVRADLRGIATMGCPTRLWAARTIAPASIAWSSAGAPIRPRLASARSSCPARSRHGWNRQAMPRLGLRPCPDLEQAREPLADGLGGGEPEARPIRDPRPGKRPPTRDPRHETLDTRPSTRDPGKRRGTRPVQETWQQAWQGAPTRALSG